MVTRMIQRTEGVAEALIEYEDREAEYEYEYENRGDKPFLTL